MIYSDRKKKIFIRMAFFQYTQKFTLERLLYEIILNNYGHGLD